MARRQRRYYSLDDCERGVTPSQLKRFGRAKQRDFMLCWFRRNFEDPAEETPYVSAEGGYQYIWGGPYDAKEELWNEFEDVIPEDRINEAVETVERGGIVDWAPGPEHPERRQLELEAQADAYSEPEPDLDESIRQLEAGVQPRLGTLEEFRLRGEVRSRLAELRSVVEAAKPAHGGIGHNRPPIDDEGIEENLARLEQAATSISSEIQRGEPDAVKIGRSAQLLRNVLNWAAKKADIGVDAFVKTLGAGAATGIVLGISGWWSDILSAAHLVATAVAKWLETVTVQF